MNELPQVRNVRKAKLAAAAAALAQKEGVPVLANETTDRLLLRVAVKVGVPLAHNATKGDVLAALLTHYADV